MGGRAGARVRGLTVLPSITTEAPCRTNALCSVKSTRQPASHSFPTDSSEKASISGKMSARTDRGGRVVIGSATAPQDFMCAPVGRRTLTGGEQGQTGPHLSDGRR